MNSEKLIEKYLQFVQDKKVAQETILNSQIEVAKKEFEDNCTKFLQGLEDDLNPSNTVECRIQTEGFNRASSLIFSKKISYLTVEGEITQVYMLNGEKWKSAIMDFGPLRITQTKVLQGYVDLPATELDLGRLFANIAKYVPVRDARTAEEVEANRNRFLDFSWILTEGRLVEQLNKGIEAFPDDAKLLQEKALEAAQRIQDMRKKEYEQQLAEELEQSERDQLRKMAEIAWQKPFEVFKFQYGARVDEDDFENFITDTFFTVDETADDRGYFRVYENGELKRSVKPKNVMAIERVKIADPDKAPFELKRRVLLNSKNIVNVSTWVYLPPVEYFTFDYEMLKLAAEAEDANNDQAQE